MRSKHYRSLGQQRGVGTFLDPFSLIVIIANYCEFSQFALAKQLISYNFVAGILIRLKICFKYIGK